MYRFIKVVAAVFCIIMGIALICAGRVDPEYGKYIFASAVMWIVYKVIGSGSVSREQA